MAVLRYQTPLCGSTRKMPSSAAIPRNLAQLSGNSGKRIQWTDNSNQTNNLRWQAQLQSSRNYLTSHAINYFNQGHLRHILRFMAPTISRARTLSRGLALKTNCFVRHRPKQKVAHQSNRRCELDKNMAGLEFHAR